MTTVAPTATTPVGTVAALAALHSARGLRTSPAGKWVSAAVTVDGALGSVTEYTFCRASDGKWRWTWTDTYGNTSGVHGPGCDASGFPLPPADAAKAQALYESRHQS